MTAAPATVAVRVFRFAVRPSFQLPTAAIPNASVVTTAEVTVPPPVETENDTGRPASAFPAASRTITVGRAGSVPPAIAACRSPASAARAEREWVLYAGSFSKVLAPALRLGWIVAPPELLPLLAIATIDIDIGNASDGVDVTITHEDVTVLDRKTGLPEKFNFSNAKQSKRYP